MNFVAILVDELDQLFWEADLGQSKLGNTNYGHALLLKSQVPLFPIIWLLSVLSLALEEEGNGEVPS